MPYVTLSIIAIAALWFRAKPFRRHDDTREQVERAVGEGDSPAMPFLTTKQGDR